MIIGLDFDGTVVTHEYPRVGKDIGAVPVLKKLAECGHKFVLFTMRSSRNGTLQDAIKWFEENGIPLYGVNRNPQQDWTDSPKAYCHLYIDDAGIGTPTKNDGERDYVDWGEIEKMLIKKRIIPSEEELNESKKKVVKNDEGQVVPEKCDKCGGDVVLQIHGEPVYVCKECGKYFGTMPCNLKENRIMKKNIVRINENTLRKIIAESVKKILNESTFFPGNDPVFPTDLAEKVKEIAEENGIRFEYKGDYVRISAHFKDEMAWYTISELYGVKVNKDGLINYWQCLIQPSGACHASGPGYPDTAVRDQKPISEEEFLSMVNNDAELLARYLR